MRRPKKSGKTRTVRLRKGRRSRKTQRINRVGGYMA